METDPSHTGRLERLADWGIYRIYKADLMSAQVDLYEKEPFPFPYVRAEQNSGSCVSWTLLDDAERIEYEVPCLKTVHLRVKVAAQRKIPSFGDPIQSIMLEHDAGRVTELSGGSCEGDLLRSLVEVVRRVDPDVVFTDD